MKARLEMRVRLPLAHFELDVDVSSSARTLGVFGPSGAGKTSLIEAVAGWRAPAAGRIRLGDTLLLDDAADFSLAIEERGVGYVPQDALLLPHWTVARNVRAGEARGGEPSADRELFEYVCQQSNYAHELMVGTFEKVSRTEVIVP